MAGVRTLIQIRIAVAISSKSTAVHERNFYFLERNDYIQVTTKFTFFTFSHRDNHKTKSFNIVFKDKRYTKLHHASFLSNRPSRRPSEDSGHPSGGTCTDFCSDDEKTCCRSNGRYGLGRWLLVRFQHQSSDDQQCQRVCCWCLLFGDSRRTLQVLARLRLQHVLPS